MLVLMAFSKLQGDEGRVCYPAHANNIEPLHFFASVCADIMANREAIVVVKYNGDCYTLHTRRDQRIMAVGAKLAQELMDLIKITHHGYVTEAKMHWRGLFARLQVASKPPASSTSSISISHLGHSLASSCTTLRPYVPDPKGRGDYMWEIDLDAPSLGMGVLSSGEVFARWPWRALYLQGMKAFVDDAEAFYYGMRDGRAIKTYFLPMTAVLTMQSAVRCVLCMRRALAPPEGVLYLIAQRRFEEKRKALQCTAAAQSEGASVVAEGLT